MDNKHNKKTLYGLFFIIMVVLSVLLIFKINSPNLLDPEMFADANGILGMMQTGYRGISKSYNFTADFYSLINFLSIYGWTSWAIIISLFSFIIILLFIYRNQPLKMDISYILWLISTISLLEIYVFHISKDFINFLFCGLILFALTKIKRNFLSLLSVLFLSMLMGIYFRSYYFLFFLFYIFLSILFNVKKRYKIILIGCFIALLFLLPQTFFDNTFNIRNIVNDNRDLSDVQSAFINVFPVGSRWSDIANFFINIFRMMFPIELAVKGELKYIAFCVYMLFLTFALVTNLIHYKEMKDNLKRVSIWCLGIIIVSAIFEPDFGSYTRHLSSYFFLWYINLILYQKVKLKIEKEPKKKGIRIFNRRVVWSK